MLRALRALPTAGLRRLLRKSSPVFPLYKRIYHLTETAPGESHRLLSTSARSRTAGGQSGGGHAPSDPQPAPQKASLSERTRAFMREYGKLGIAVYLGVSCVSVGTLYTAIRMGVDVHGLLVRVGVPPGRFLDAAGTFALAYGVHKLLLPLRLFVTYSLTRSLHRRLRGISGHS